MSSMQMIQWNWKTFYFKLYTMASHARKSCQAACLAVFSYPFYNLLFGMKSSAFQGLYSPRKYRWGLRREA